MKNVKTHFPGNNETNPHKALGISTDTQKHIIAKLLNNSIDTARQSHHHSVHVGASAYIIDKSNGDNNSGERGSYFSFANKIPKPLRHAHHDEYNFTPRDPETSKIGDGHPTVHGEFRIFMNADENSEGLLLACNTPLCANCILKAITYGVDAIYIDEASLPGNSRGKDQTPNAWSEKRSELWEDLCLPLLRAAKIPVYTVKDKSDPENKKSSIDPKSIQITELVKGVPPEQRPKPQFSVQIFSRKEFERILKRDPEKFLSKRSGLKRVIAAAKDKNGDDVFLYAKDSHPPGFDNKTGVEMTAKFKDADYKFTLDPLIQIAMTTSKNDMTLIDGKIATNALPDAARQLEMLYAGVREINYRQDFLEIPRSDGEKGMRQLTDLGIINYKACKADQAMQALLTKTNDSSYSAPHTEPETA